MKYDFQCDGMLTIECQSPKLLKLNKDQASQLSVLVSKDLSALLQINNQSALVFCGATFSSEQLLQPKFPIQAHINQYASAAFQGEINADQVLSIGANNGVMPTGLEPDQALHGLLHLPFCLHTNDANLAETFEAQLMHKGMVSPPTYECLNVLFNSHETNPINHANYMTYLDLVAMMHNHYEHQGWTDLWQIIETALVNKAPKKAIKTPANNQFYLVDHLLFTPHFTWSQYSRYFGTTNTHDYINWLMAQRLALGAFTAHGLQIKSFNTTQWPINEAQICLGQFEQQLIKGSYLVEDLVADVGQSDDTIYHQDDHAGVVAISVKHPGNTSRQAYYPITAAGITDIEKHIQQLDGSNKNLTRQLLSHNPDCLL